MAVVKQNFRLVGLQVVRNTAGEMVDLEASYTYELVDDVKDRLESYVTRFVQLRPLLTATQWAGAQTMVARALAVASADAGV